jgi:flagellar hook-basal body protein
LDSGYYAACSALKTQTNALDIAANNIANVSTAGYRGQIPSFQALLVQTAGPQMGGWEHLVNEHAVLNGSRLDLGQGNLEHTGNPMNFAVEGLGFFAVQTKAGTMYTRNGSFQVSASGQLQNLLLQTRSPLPAQPITLAPMARKNLQLPARCVRACWSLRMSALWLRWWD